LTLLPSSLSRKVIDAASCAAVTVTTLCGSRKIGPFGGDGGAPGAVGENLVHWPDGRVQRLDGNDECDLPEGAVFEMRTPGGGGWGAV